ncbi:uncharacterized protein G2W53_012741 [Senna tora]|uniref:Uncharacterized protein n=1 Tax=Senna tora TaxID=362788 RepID=A0A834TXJ8_9FABA|nr:uncharacterized protein G2W53_012741 [Senna tora]
MEYALGRDGEQVIVDSKAAYGQKWKSENVTALLFFRTFVSSIFVTRVTMRIVNLEVVAIQWPTLKLALADTK